MELRIDTNESVNNLQFKCQKCGMWFSVTSMCTDIMTGRSLCPNCYKEENK